MFEDVKEQYLKPSYNYTYKHLTSQQDVKEQYLKPSYNTVANCATLVMM